MVQGRSINMNSACAYQFKHRALCEFDSSAGSLAPRVLVRLKDDNAPFEETPITQSPTKGAGRSAKPAVADHGGRHSRFKAPDPFHSGCPYICIVEMVEKR